MTFKTTLSTLSLTAVVACLQSVVAQTPLSWGFDHPQDSTRTKVWWFHGETVGTHSGITANLESFRQQGVGGVVYYDQVHGNGEGAFAVFSPQWWDELLFSAQEAGRLGLTFEVNASNGYVAGGRWITPDKSMQRLAATDTVVEGGRDLMLRLPMVKAPGNWHRDVAVMAIPYDEELMADSRGVFSRDSTVVLRNPQDTTYINIDFGRDFTARSITYVTGGRGKARTSSMQVPPFSPRTDDMHAGTTTRWDFFGCGFRTLPPIGQLQVSSDGIHYRSVCALRPKYSNMGGQKEQTIAFPATRGHYFRIALSGWGTASKSDERLTFGQMVLSARAAVDVWQEKASLISELMEADRTPRYSVHELADFSHAIDLTASTSEDGTLSWRQAPQGKWLVLRLVAVSTGGHTKHGRKEALGLECDKLSVEGARQQWQCYVKPVIDSIRAHGATLQGVCMDSHEAGPQNWTADFIQEFQCLRGYDMRPYLPVMAGFVVGSAEKSERFLFDLRHTINDLITDRYYGEFNRLCRAEGLTLTAQAVGGALCMAADAVSVKRLVDKPQAEFWGYQTEGNYDIKDCSSAAHIYGKPIASGEAFTDITYQHTLADVKNLADYAYAFGINEFVVCASAYQPWLDHRLSTANGRQYVLNRQNTLWPLSKAFWDYQARCSWMLRQGQPVSDFCLFLGDDIPARILAHKLPELPHGYDFDAFTTDALIHRMSVSDGRIVLPGGISYAMMIMPPDGQLTDASRRQIERFRQQGAHIFDPQTDKRTLADAISHAGLQPDVEAPPAEKLYFCHRQTAREHIYFLNNHSDNDLDGSFSFRARGSNVEVWNPATSVRQTVECRQENGRTVIALNLHARESIFIIISDQPASCQSSSTASPTSHHHLSLPWTVTFDPAMGGPAEPVIMQHLTDWTSMSDPRVQYFSGTAIYKTTFTLPKKSSKSIYCLQLALLNAAAEVIINGQKAGIVWCAPWSIDISRLVRKGKNDIELRVAGTLWNRLVGDARTDVPQRVMWQTHPLAKADDELMPTGLISATIEEYR